MTEKMKYRFEQKADSNVYKLYIYDDVTAVGDFDWKTWTETESETSASYFKKQLTDIPDNGEIELHINSCGGDVKEGTAIYNMLKQHKAHKTCYVDGFAYSIASVIAMACDYIVMGLGTSMLIHNMAMMVYGDAQTLRKCADDLDVLMASNRQIYLQKARNLTEEELIQMMDAETFLTPDQCLEYGFCDEIAETYHADEQQTAQALQQKLSMLMSEYKKLQYFNELLIQQKEKDDDPEDEPEDPEEPEAEPGTNDDGVDPEEPKLEPEDPEDDPEKKKKTSQGKVLELAGAFLNAFSAGKGN